MSNYNSNNSGDLSAQTATSGVVIPNNVASINNSTLGVNQAGCNLGSGTYYFAMGGNAAPVPAETSVMGIHLQWVALLAATVTIEVCNFPGFLSAMREGGVDVTDFDAAGTGNWIQYNPALSVGIYANTIGTNNTVTALTVTAGGTNAGGAIINCVDLGFERVRIKVVTTVGGVFRCGTHGKLGS